MWFFAFGFVLALLGGFLLGWRLGARKHMLYSLIPFFGLEDERWFEDRKGVKDRREVRLGRIIEIAEAKGNVTVADVQDFFCITEFLARKYLMELVARGTLTRAVGLEGTFVITAST